jgi:hypothetical protein
VRAERIVLGLLGRGDREVFFFWVGYFVPRTEKSGDVSFGFFFLVRIYHAERNHLDIIYAEDIFLEGLDRNIDQGVEIKKPSCPP